MKSINYLTILLTSLVLLACSPDNSPKTKLFEDQRIALEKAKGAASSVQQQTQEMQQNLEKQTQ